MIGLLVLVTAQAGFGQENEDPVLRQVERLGRALYEYDQAAAKATDALMDLHPEQSRLGMFIAWRTDTGWKVGFGHLDPEGTAFLLAYEAGIGPDGETWRVETFPEPVRRTGFYRQAARAWQAVKPRVKTDFAPLNVAMLPGDGESIYVYVYPGQTTFDHYRLGGDTRYTCDLKRNTVTETRRLHRDVLLMPYAVKSDEDKVDITSTTAVVTNVPVETDILYVLSRRFSAQHVVLTKQWTYILTPKGRIAKIPTARFFDLDLKKDK